ncbi:DUF6572 domain-containing protein [Cupriavidus cauae]|uniref:DUF6572 domain-containing protein n=1 Tax=Cupriavidus cauae TaxID=2608999 RepID=UPI001680B3B7|nr:DUF6572 domain-containing protein [Cupriavidus cauae]
MAVETSSTIDAVGVYRLTGAIHLSIIDALPWDDRHLELLQEKLNTYLAFIESGEIYRSYPDATERSLVIDIIMRFRPSQRAEFFFEQARAVIESYGATLTLRHAGTGYADDSA